MPFGVKNAGATYQRLVDKAFQKQIGRNLEVYVDDLVINSCTEQEIMRDIEETFRTLREINMKLNPKNAPSEWKRAHSWEEAEEKLSDPWTLFTDESSCIDGSGANMILTNLEGTKFTYAVRFRFDATNNEAKYEALISGIRITKQIGITNLQANVDSRLVANQVNGSFIEKESGMMQCLEKVKTLASSFKKFSIKQVPESKNKKANALSKIGSTSFAHLTKQVLVEELNEKSITKVEVLAVVEKQLSDNPFKDWCEKLCIRQRFASVKHSQANGLVERANRSFEEGIKARLDERSKDWIEEVPHVLWARRTMIKSSNKDTPFSLTYRMEAVILAEIGMPTLRTTKIDMVQNDEALEINLDLLEERREQAAIREAKSKAKMEKYYNSKVRNTSFKPRDLVYRNNDASHAKDSGKLSPKWDGPYEVTKALATGAYKLRDRIREILPRT
nr:reverse transcriptase domain-containing protein [Tanacetum cinerariifolium]